MDFEEQLFGMFNTRMHSIVFHLCLMNKKKERMKDEPYKLHPFDIFEKAKHENFNFVHLHSFLFLIHQA